MATQSLSERIWWSLDLGHGADALQLLGILAVADSMQATF